MLRTRSFPSLSGNLQLIVAAEQTSTTAEDAHHVKTALKPMCLGPYHIENFPKGLALHREENTSLWRIRFGNEYARSGQEVTHTTGSHAIVHKLSTSKNHVLSEGFPKFVPENGVILPIEVSGEGAHVRFSN